MAAACLNREPPAELVTILQRRAAGSPLLVEELLATDGADAATLVPVTVHELVARRSATLSAMAQQCLRYAAVLGPVVDWTLLPPLLGTEPGGLLGALREVSDVQLLEASTDGFRFPHTLIRDAVLAAMLPPERRHRRRALAVVRAAHPDLDAPWDELAADLALLAGDSTVAAQILLAAGRRELLRGALATAEATLDRAAELAGRDERLAVECDDSLAETLALAGKTAAATAVSTRLIQRLDGTGNSTRFAEAHLRTTRVHGAAGTGPPPGRASIRPTGGWTRHPNPRSPRESKWQQRISRSPDPASTRHASARKQLSPRPNRPSTPTSSVTHWRCSVDWLDESTS